MSPPGTPASPAASVFRLTGNSALDSMIGLALAAASTSLATWAIGHLNLQHIDATTLSLAIFGVLGAAATAGWKWFNSRINSAVAVNAGRNAAVVQDVEMHSTGDGTRTVVPVTPAAAAQIVKDFGSVKVTIPEEPAFTDKLNIAEGAQP